MLNKSFEIGLPDENSDVLFIEVGETYCMLSFLNAANKSLAAVSVYTFDAFSLQESVKEILDSTAPENGLTRVIASPAFPEALLVPRKFYSSDFYLNTLYNMSPATSLHDVVGEWQLVNSYAIPASVFHEIKTRFPSAEFMHVYTPLIKRPNETETDNQLMVHFMNNQFRVLLKMHGQIHLVQTYVYASPMDVAYYLLKILAEFHLSQEEVYLAVSGFIDKKSALYKELYSYFLNIHFMPATSLNISMQDHPDHFFKSIDNLAACVL